MGLLDRFFKSWAANPEDKRSETDAPDPAAFLVPRERAPILPSPPRNPRVEIERAAPAASSRTIIVMLADVIARIPSELLQENATSVRCELRFSEREYFADIPRGRVTVALSNIAAQCPAAFRVQITDDEDREVRLPLQKVLDQLIDPATPRPPVTVPEPARPNAAPPAEPAPVSAPAETASPAPAAAASPEVTIELSLAAIIGACGDDVFPAGRPKVNEGVRVTLPFAPIERQLASGTVEISAGRLVALLPAQFAGLLSLPDSAKISLPIEEIFQNLPKNVAVTRKPEAAVDAPTPAAPPTQPQSEPESPPPLAAVVPEPPPAQEEKIPAPPEAVAPVSEPAPPQPAPADPPAPAPFRFFPPTPSIPLHAAPPGISGAVVENAPPPPPEANAPTPEPVPPLPPLAPEPPAAPANAAPAEPTPPAIERITGIPSLRPIELRPRTDVVGFNEPGPRILESTESDASASPATSDVRFFQPPVARPLVVLPPPIVVAQTSPQTLAPIAAAPSVEAAAPTLETTADQTAVLEFLAEGGDGQK